MRISLKAMTLSSALLWGGAMLFVGLIHLAAAVLWRRLPADREFGLPGGRYRTQAGARVAWHTVRVRGWRHRRLALWLAIQRFRRRYESRH